MKTAGRHRSRLRRTACIRPWAISCIYRIETAQCRPDLDVLGDIASALGVTTNYLIEGVLG